jgi:hypothetical protein
VLRPDCFTSVLNDYVKSSLDIKLIEPNWNSIFSNPNFKTIIINMGSTSNISNSSSMSRIHKNLFQIAQKMSLKIKSINCNFMSLSELKDEVKNVDASFLLFKNVHLAAVDIIDFIKKLSDDINGECILK